MQRPRRLRLAALVVGVAAAAAGGGGASRRELSLDAASTRTAPRPPAAAKTPPSSTGRPSPRPPEVTIGDGPDLPPYGFGANPLAILTSLRVATLSDAAQHVPFTPALPPTPGPPADLFVTDERQTQSDYQTVAAVWRPGDGVPFQVLERSAGGETQASLDQWIQPGYCTSCAFAEPLTLPTGERAIVLGAPGSSTVVKWLHDGVEVTVMGSYDGFPKATAVSLANELAPRLP